VEVCIFGYFAEGDILKKFLGAPGGTRKMFLISLILYKMSSQSNITLA